MAKDNENNRISFIIWCLTLPLVIFISVIIYIFLDNVVFAGRYLSFISAFIVTLPFLFIGLIISCVGITGSTRRLMKYKEKTESEPITSALRNDELRRIDEKTKEETLKRIEEERILNGITEKTDNSPKDRRGLDSSKSVQNKERQILETRETSLLAQHKRFLASSPIIISLSCIVALLLFLLAISTGGADGISYAMVIFMGFVLSYLIVRGLSLASIIPKETLRLGEMQSRKTPYTQQKEDSRKKKRFLAYVGTTITAITATACVLLCLFFIFSRMPILTTSVTVISSVFMIVMLRIIAKKYAEIDGIIGYDGLLLINIMAITVLLFLCAAVAIPIIAIIQVKREICIAIWICFAVVISGMIVWKTNKQPIK